MGVAPTKPDAAITNRFKRVEAEKSIALSCWGYQESTKLWRWRGIPGEEVQNTRSWGSEPFKLLALVSRPQYLPPGGKYGVESTKRITAPEKLS